MTYAAVNPETIVVTSFLSSHYQYINVYTDIRENRDYLRASPLKQLTAGVEHKAIYYTSQQVSTHPLQ